jgi:hypothetical protein
MVAGATLWCTFALCQTSLPSPLQNSEGRCKICWQKYHRTCHKKKFGEKTWKHRQIMVCDPNPTGWCSHCRRLIAYVSCVYPSLYPFPATGTRLCAMRQLVRHHCERRPLANLPRVCPGPIPCKQMGTNLCCSGKGRSGLQHLIEVAPKQTKQANLLDATSTPL